MDILLYWNDVALEANKTSFTDPTKMEQHGPTLSSRALAIVHLAMHDAFCGAASPVAFSAWLGPLLPPLTAGTDTEAAISGAAHCALSMLYTKQVGTFDSKLAAFAYSSPSQILGLKYGQMVASKILDDRHNDPTNDATGYVPPLGRWQHQPDPDEPTQTYAGPFYGSKSRPFACATAHILKAPPQGTPDYYRALKQVRGIGIRTDKAGKLPATLAKGTPNDYLAGYFWGYDGAKMLGTPPRLYNLILRQIAMEQSNDLEKNVRLFALANAAMGDAGIFAWREKYKHNLWRPVVGIREDDISLDYSNHSSNAVSDNNDPDWLPLGLSKSNTYVSDPMNQKPPLKNTTPNFPSYPSGHATFCAAAFHITRMFYGVTKGDRKKDTLFKNYFVSEELNGITTDNTGTLRPKHNRSFPDGLWQMIVENGFARVYLGVHWSFDAFKTDANEKPILDQKTGGVDLGLQIAEDIFASGLKRSSLPTT